jgi:DNA polymerase III subunit chi
MTERVDFYVLKSSAVRQRLTFACRLAEKAYQHDLKVVLLQNDAENARALDELLWTFNERSFVPHELCVDGKIDPATPVHVAFDSATMDGVDLLINLTDRLPPAWERHGRVAEIIDSDDERRRLGRERFKAYRDLKVTLETHQLNESADI